MLHPKGATSFSEYASNVFKPYIVLNLDSATRLDLVWDRYIKTYWKARPWQSVGKEFAGDWWQKGSL